MATKIARLTALGGMHTSGIYSDMTVDGPEIGTLVVIFDRAKNLPNRRSMGKQDPYAAARLGKEAKKTETDKRGGQTPRWDQELRFTVHDSPDYQQLKLSVFNDDKKTELIGEAWVDLTEVIVPGGGQSDIWQTLNCKGKYAGEVRIELTYYDTRPKIEKPSVTERRRESSKNAQMAMQSPSVSGPRENAYSTPVKRRPLPGDVTAASPSPVAVQSPLSTPQDHQTSPHNARSMGTSPTHHSRHHYRDRTSPYEFPLPANRSRESLNSPNRYDQQYEDPSLAPARRQYDVQPIEPSPYVARKQPATRIPMPPHDPRSGQHESPRRPHSYVEHSRSDPALPTHYTSEDPQQRRPAQHIWSENQSHAPQNMPYREDHRRSLGTSGGDGSPQSSGFRPQDRYDRHPTAQYNAYQASSATYDPSDSHRAPMKSLQPTVEDETDVPPPPPVHRSSAPAAVPRYDPVSQQVYRDDVPAPLNIGSQKRQSIGDGYLQGPDGYIDPVPERRRTMPSPTYPPTGSQPQSRPVSRDTMGPSPLRNEFQPNAPPVRYEAVNGVEGSHVARRSSNVMPVAPPRDDPYQQPPTYDVVQSRPHSQSDGSLVRFYGSGPAPPPPPPQSQQEVVSKPDSPRYYRPAQDAATPLVKPRAISPVPTDVRESRGPLRSTPTRKSVSPRPPTSDGIERRPSSTPFSPDDFGVFNPNAPRPISSHSQSPFAGTIPGAAESSGDKIVGFHGQEVDPSDHLPVDSWAPEPERKGPERKVPPREREKLTGARELGTRARDRTSPADAVIRHAVNGVAGVASGPTTTSSAGSSLGMASDYGSTGRNRLQKRSGRPASAVIMPGPGPITGVPMPPQNNVLRERDIPNAGYAYGGPPGADAYAITTTRGGAPPPIPAKIPMDAVPDDLARLSEEMSRIDIGQSVGRRGGMLTRRGHAFN